MKRLLLAGLCLIVPDLAQAETKTWSYGPIPVYQFTDPNFCGMLLIDNDKMFSIYEYQDRHLGIAIYGRGNTIKWTKAGTVAASIDGSTYSLEARMQNEDRTTLYVDLGSYSVNGSLRNFLDDLSAGRSLTVSAGSAYQATFSLIGFAATAITLLHKCGDVIAGQSQQSCPVTRPAPTRPPGGAIEVALNSSGGVNTVNGFINGMPVKFILDSGSGDVTITPSFAKALVAQGSLSSDDYIKQQSYVYADGKTYRKPQYHLRSVTIGGYTVTDVTCSVSNDDRAAFLLGQSFLGRLSSWSIDNTRHVLIIR